MIELHIQQINSFGQGLAGEGGKKYLVPSVISGERVQVEVTGKSHGYNACLLVKILNPSPLRTQPLCPWFGECGGCHLQHMDYPEQLRTKQRWLKESLTRWPGVLLEDIQASPAPYAYRNRITLHHDGKQWGFFRPHSHDIIPIERCCLASEALNERLQGLDGDVLKGPKNFELREDDRACFSQVNSFQNDHLVEEVLKNIPSKKSQNILELYCGFGNLTFPLSKVVKKIVAVEIDKEAYDLAEARRTHEKNKKIHFILGDVMDAVFQMSSNLEQLDTIVCDPPRAGLGDVARFVARLKPGCVVYVSCHPQSFFRDALIFQNGGLILKKVVPIDMFPQTRHVEMVGVFHSM